NTKLDTQIQNVDSQILIARRGSVAIAVAIAYLYYRRGLDSVAVAQELRIHPPLVRQTLARLHLAATGTVYRCPSYQRILEQKRAATAARRQRVREFRAEMKHVRDLFRRLKKIVNATNRKAEQKRLAEKLVGVIPSASRKNRWTLDRLRFIYVMRLQGRS